MSEKCKKCGSKKVYYCGPNDYGEVHLVCKKCGHHEDIDNPPALYWMFPISIAFFAAFVFMAYTKGDHKLFLFCIPSVIYWLYLKIHGA
jgi:uncharacterized protein (DUF983 family)